jgi:hypothetical protein
MYRQELKAASSKFHKLINAIEIARQLSRKAVTKVLTLLVIKFKLCP